MFGRKDADGFFRPFADLTPRVFTTTFDRHRRHAAEALAEAARQAGLEAEPVDGVEGGPGARPWLANGAAPHVLICGGLHFAGEVLAMSPDTWPR